MSYNFFSERTAYSYTHKQFCPLQRQIPAILRRETFLSLKIFISEGTVFFQILPNLFLYFVKFAFVKILVEIRDSREWRELK